MNIVQIISPKIYSENKTLYSEENMESCATLTLHEHLETNLKGWQKSTRFRGFHFLFPVASFPSFFLFTHCYGFVLFCFLFVCLLAFCFFGLVVGPTGVETHDLALARQASVREASIFDNSVTNYETLFP